MGAISLAFKVTLKGGTMFPEFRRCRIAKGRRNFTVRNVDEDSVKKSGPWLLVGLGNPGSKYNGTRHNIGFEVIDHIANSEGIPMSAMQCKALVGKGRILGVPVLLAKPQTYMNLSGESAGPLAQFYKIPPQRVLAIYDDLDLELGVMKLLPKGGHGGHNGMKSLIQHFKGSKDFPRLRLGIGRPDGDMAPAAYVLQKFSSREQKEIDFILQRSLSSVRTIMENGLDKTVSMWNSPKQSQIFGR